MEGQFHLDADTYLAMMREEIEVYDGLDNILGMRAHGDHAEGMG